MLLMAPKPAKIATFRTTGRKWTLSTGLSTEMNRMVRSKRTVPSEFRTTSGVELANDAVLRALRQQDAVQRKQAARRAVVDTVQEKRIAACASAHASRLASKNALVKRRTDSEEAALQTLKSRCTAVQCNLESSRY